MKVLIAGTRTFSDYEVVCKDMASYVEIKGLPSCIISGGATGADALGERWAKENNVPLELYKADWKQYGRFAGPFRNKEMAKVCDCAFIYWDGQSRGTRNMMKELEAEGKGYILTTYP